MRALLVLGLTGCWHDAIPDAPPPVAVSIRPRPVVRHVEAAVFGSFEPGFAPTDRITLVVNAGYGWRIQVPCTKDVAFRETLKMPAPGDWGPNVSRTSTINEDRTEVTTEDVARCTAGWIEHKWFATLGDPDGVYYFTVEIDGYAPIKFRPVFTRP